MKDSVLEVLHCTCGWLWYSQISQQLYTLIEICEYNRVSEASLSQLQKFVVGMEL